MPIVTHPRLGRTLRRTAALTCLAVCATTGTAFADGSGAATSTDPTAADGTTVTAPAPAPAPAPAAVTSGAPLQSGPATGPDTGDPYRSG